MRKSIQLKLILLSTIYYLLFTILGCHSRPLYKDSRLLMGTIVEVTSNDKRAADLVFERIREVERLLSKFNNDSQIYKLNVIGHLRVDREVIDVIKKARYFNRMSDGVFDITVAPLADLWKQAIETGKMPSKISIEAAKSLVGIDNIIIEEDTSLVRFKKKGVKLDLGGIAKGYAVDTAIERLRQAGITNALVNAGGDMYCLGKNGGRPWNVGIRNPRNPERILDYLSLIDKAVATSGDYEQYFIINNRRLCHIIDPKTGYSADKGIVSVTVIAPDCLTADALATSIFILGKEKGLELLSKFKGVEAHIITDDEI